MKKDTTFPLPLRDLLIKINPKAIEEVSLMPGHWALYERLLDLADDDGLISGNTAPAGLSELYEDLFEHKILEQAPLTYKAWKERLEKSNTTEESDEIQTVSSGIDAGTEVDLDFLEV